jgi:hypothetical protein
LRIVAEHDTAGSYEFDIALAVEEVSTGKVWFASDSGCSCPTPFEGHDFPGDDWQLISSRAELLKALEEFCPRQEDHYRDFSAGERLEFADKVTAALGAVKL